MIYIDIIKNMMYLWDQREIWDPVGRKPSKSNLKLNVCLKKARPGAERWNQRKIKQYIKMNQKISCFHENKWLVLAAAWTVA